MKKFIFLFVIISISLISCLEDLDTLKKKSLFIFYQNMKSEIINDNINWIEKNSHIKNIESIKNIIIDNNDSIKNLISSENGEYSVTISYSVHPYKGYYIIRNTLYSPTYYYIKLINDNNKWKIESIDKLPIKS